MKLWSSEVETPSSNKPTGIFMYLFEKYNKTRRGKVKYRRKADPR